MFQGGLLSWVPGLPLLNVARPCLEPDTVKEFVYRYTYLYTFTIRGRKMALLRPRDAGTVGLSPAKGVISRRPGASFSSIALTARSAQTPVEPGRFGR